MNNLDELLAATGGVPLPARLAMIDEAVLSALADHQRVAANGSLRSLGFAALAALAFGVLSANYPGSRATAVPSVTPFGVPPALVPSSLLLASK